MIFAATFAGIEIAAAQDVFELTAPPNESVRIVEATLAQTSDFQEAQDEILSIQMVRGHTTAGSGGAAVTPVPWNKYGGTTEATVARNNTTIASAGSAQTLYADGWNVRAGWYWRAPPLRNSGRIDVQPQTSPHAGKGLFMPEQMVIGPGETFVVRLSLPADTMTSLGSLIFETLGA